MEGSVDCVTDKEEEVDSSVSSEIVSTSNNENITDNTCRSNEDNAEEQNSKDDTVKDNDTSGENVHTEIKPLITEDLSTPSDKQDERSHVNNEHRKTTIQTEEGDEPVVTVDKVVTEDGVNIGDNNIKHSNANTSFKNCEKVSGSNDAGEGDKKPVDKSSDDESEMKGCILTKDEYINESKRIEEKDLKTNDNEENLDSKENSKILTNEMAPDDKDLELNKDNNNKEKMDTKDEMAPDDKDLELNKDNNNKEEMDTKDNIKVIPDGKSHDNKDLKSNYDKEEEKDNKENIKMITDEKERLGEVGNVPENKNINNEVDLMDEFDSDIIKEGKAEIINFSKNVFYNAVQEFNRDLSVAAISVFSEEHWKDPRCKARGVKRTVDDKKKEDECEKMDLSEERVPGIKYDDGIVVLEALSATGLRSIRYAKEVPGINEVIANDLSLPAVESIDKNVSYNKVEHLVSTSHDDASLFMYKHKGDSRHFDVIDLDPYGCPSRFLDAAVQSLRDGGLLLVTCTDMAVLAGNSPETCYVKYGAVSLRNSACHEMAIRITLQCIEAHANRYSRYIVPLLSISADFYIRVFVKLYTSPVMCKKTTSKLSMVYQCTGCQTFTLSPLGLLKAGMNGTDKPFLPQGPSVNQKCFHCSHLHYLGGPIWSGPIHDLNFIEKMLVVTEKQEFRTEKRMEGMLELIREEIDVPLYYTVEALCSKVHCEAIPQINYISALLNAGYRVSLSHCAPNSIKTNAPPIVIWDIIRCWVKTHPVNPKRLIPGSVVECLLQRKPSTIANFDIHPNAITKSKMKKLLRYQQNPQPYWGPGCRDKANYPSQEKMSKSHVNQNKRRKSEMKAAVKSKYIDIIEVVTLTDDEDEDEEKKPNAVKNVSSITEEDADN